ncbi:MAG TPA: riboflavin synthase [Burkholderiales bacterium]|nr:riboflavin synthase [Burkholderiales bacterium]
MFTGIVAAVGTVRSIVRLPQGARMDVAAGALDLADVKAGDSIAVNGVCLTATALAGDGFSADLSQATLDCIAGFAPGAEVNLEKALRLADRLGGHLVSGHVDGVGEVLRFEPTGDNVVLGVRTPDDLARYIARKGSIALDGVSLTVNAVRRGDFEVNLIPHTLAVTNLKHLRPGSKVNLEVDLLARHVERLLSAS